MVGELYYSFRRLASNGFPSGCSKSVCVRLHSESSEPMIFFSQTMPDEHPPTLPPSRWPALITLPTLAKFQLVWRRLCDVVLLPSCLVKHSLTDASLLIEYRFQVPRVAPSTLQLRSRGRPSLPFSALSLLPSLSSALPRFLILPLPHFLCPGLLPPSFPSSPPSILHLPSIPEVQVELQSKQLTRHFHLI